MVYAGFRDARWDIQGAPLAQSDPGAAPNPNDEEHMDARPDQEDSEIGEANQNFPLQLEKQEKKSFKDLATVLSQLPKPAQGSIRNKPGYPRLSQVIPADSQVIPDMTVFRVGDGTVSLAIVIYIDGSFVKHSIPVKPI